MQTRQKYRSVIRKSSCKVIARVTRELKGRSVVHENFYISISVETQLPAMA